MLVGGTRWSVITYYDYDLLRIYNEYLTQKS